MTDTTSYMNMLKQNYSDIADGLVKTNEEHNNKIKDYWDVLLKDVKNNPSRWDGKLAFDYGLGGGRDIINLLGLAKFKRVDGCDIVQDLLNGAKENIKKVGFSEDQFKLYLTSGEDLNGISDNIYDFTMFFAVLHHIPVYDLRHKILEEIYRIMKPDGLFCFQMVMDSKEFAANPPKFRYPARGYYENYVDARSTNGECDVNLENPEFMHKDLDDIGFTKVMYEVRPSPWPSREYWVYFSCTKGTNGQTQKITE